MQYIPAGATGETYFILLNRYQDGERATTGPSSCTTMRRRTIIAEQEGGNATAPIVF